MNYIQNPNIELESVIKNSELPSLAQNYAELVIDGIIDDGVLTDIPLLSTVIGAMKFGNSINKHIAAKKLYKFLFELHSIEKDKRIKKIDEINNSRKYQSKVGEMIFELLDKIESDGKPEIIGKLFAAVIEEKIDFQTYLRLAHIVKNLFYYDLVWLVENTRGKKVFGDINDSLYISGLITMDFTGKFENILNDNHTSESSAMLTDLGSTLIVIGMK